MRSAIVYQLWYTKQLRGFDFQTAIPCKQALFRNLHFAERFPQIGREIAIALKWILGPAAGGPCASDSN